MTHDRHDTRNPRPAAPAMAPPPNPPSDTMVHVNIVRGLLAGLDVEGADEYLQIVLRRFGQDEYERVCDWVALCEGARPKRTF
jgi:hypothetical protein